MYFWTYGLRKTWFDKCLKILSSDDPLKSNMVNEPKNWWNLNASTFTIFIDPLKDNYGSKSLFQWYAKSDDCLLTPWLPTISIFSSQQRQFIATFWDEIISETKNIFSFIFSIFWILIHFSNFSKKHDRHSWYMWSVKCLKSVVSEDPFRSNTVKGPKRCSKLNESTFTIFIDPCEYNWDLKSLSEWHAKSYDCLLTHWLPMTSILFLKEAILCNIFRCIYLRNEKYFLTFFLHFLNSNSILKI